MDGIIGFVTWEDIPANGNPLCGVGGDIFVYPKDEVWYFLIMGGVVGIHMGMHVCLISSSSSSCSLQVES